MVPPGVFGVRFLGRIRQMKRVIASIVSFIALSACGDAVYKTVKSSKEFVEMGSGEQLLTLLLCWGLVLGCIVGSVQLGKWLVSSDQQG
jgi:hypothetical protein